MSLLYTGVLEHQPSDKGNNVRFSKTLKQGCATHGPWAKNGLHKGPDFQASITVFERYCQDQFKGTVSIRLNRQLVKFDKFRR